MIQSIQAKEQYLDNNCKTALEKFNESKKNPTYLLGRVSESYLLETSDSYFENSPNELEYVSRSRGAYRLSRRINPLQRLFTNHVLREFDLKLVDTLPADYKGKKLLKEKLVNDEI